MENEEPGRGIILPGLLFILDMELFRSGHSP
jgi:hypothetical protein